MLNSCIVNPKVGLLSSHSCYCCDALWAPRHQASKVCTQSSVASFAVFFPCRTISAYCKWRLNGAETWRQDTRQLPGTIPGGASLVPVCDLVMIEPQLSCCEAGAGIGLGKGEEPDTMFSWLWFHRTWPWGVLTTYDRGAPPWLTTFPGEGVPCIWNIGQYSSLVAAIKIGFLFPLVLLVHVFELLEILPVWGQFLFCLWNVAEYPLDVTLDRGFTKQTCCTVWKQRRGHC